MTGVADVDAVWWPETPLEDESMLGFCVRTMTENLLPHLPSFLRQAGQMNRNRHVDVVRGDADADVLAAVLGITPDALAAMRGAVVPGGVLYRGVLVDPVDLRTEVRRFAPGTLARAAVHRADWCLRTLPFCPVTLELLQTECACGTRQGWTTRRGPTFCQECGEPLADTPARPTDPADARELRAYAAMLSDGASTAEAALAGMPSEIAALPRGDVVELVIALVPILAPELGKARKARCWLDRPGPFAQAIAGAWRLLEGWPASLTDRALDIVDQRTAEPRTPGLLRVGRLLSDPVPARTPGASSVIFRQATARREAADDAGMSIDFLEAERLLRTNAQVLRDARRRGELRTTFAFRRGELLPMLDRAEIEGLAGVDAEGAALVGRRLHMPRYAVDQLAGGDLLVPASHPMHLRRYGLRVHRRSVDGLVAALEETATIIDAPLVPLTRALSVIGGREKPYLSIFRLLLDGSMPFALGKGTAPLCRRIMVTETTVSDLVTLEESSDGHYDHYVLDDARNVLNLHVRDAAAVDAYRVGMQGSASRFEREAILGLARRFVSLAELAARMGLHPTKVLAALRRVELAPHPLGWFREEAEAHFRVQDHDGNHQIPSARSLLSAVRSPAG